MIKKLNPKLVKLVDLLKDGHYHDGNALGSSLKITRSAVWKAIKKLQDHYGIKIHSLKGKGYALADQMSLLDPNKIKTALSAHRTAQDAPEKIDLRVFESVDSTNEYFKTTKVTLKHSKAIHVCLSETQTHGKGRLQRTWFSPFGRNIYFSCLYPFRKDVSELAGLSLVISLAIIKTLKQFELGNQLYVKWPNDIIYNHKKLAGSLIEVQAETHDCSQAIIGIGLNVNMLESHDHISQPWISLRQILGREIDRNELCAKLILNLIEYLQLFANEGFTRFITEWSETDGLAERTITLKNINQKIKGKAMGVNHYGHLLLQLQNGNVKAFSSGDTTILKR